MSIIKKQSKIFFPLIFSLLFGINAFGQNLHQTFAFANELKAQEQYEQALGAYNRVLFFGNGTYQEQVFQQMGACYYSLKDYENAAIYFDLAYFSEKNDSIRFELTFLKASSLLLNKNYAYAQIELFNLPDSLPLYFDQKRNFYHGITCFGLGKYREAETYFLGVLPDTSTQEEARIRQIFQNVAKAERISPKKARILSSFVPGLGQMYAGDVRNGLNSFFLTSALAVLAIHMSTNYSILDAIMSVLPWYHRYHMGGYLKAEAIAQQKKDRKLSEHYRQILTEIAKTK